jgi:RimJ/RimL family protein N-acetyltransferase
MQTPSADPLPRSFGGVVLRRLSSADLSAFQGYRHDPEVGRYQGWSPMSDADATAFLVRMSTAPLFCPGSWVQLGIGKSHSARLLGDIGLFLAGDGRHAEIGFTLARSAQGRGIAAAAVLEAMKLTFEYSAAERILGITDARNLPSVRLLERVGMEKVEARNAVFRGEPCIDYVYAVSRHGDNSTSEKD